MFIRVNLECFMTEDYLPISEYLSLENIDMTEIKEEKISELIKGKDCIIEVRNEIHYIKNGKLEKIVKGGQTFEIRGDNRYSNAGDSNTTTEECTG